ncbi:MAG: substrate-binding domain-containing protein [Anaerolineae bacterium]
MSEKTRGARLTIGYLAPAIHGGSLDQWLGAVDAAREHDVNLICIPGWSPNYPGGFQAQANVLYKLVTPENVDGLITWASAIGNYMTVEEIQAFHDRYRPLPVVTIGRTLEGIPSLLMDSYSGMREAIAHLIEVHGRRRVAFIRGPEGHFYAQERYRAYTEALEAYGIPFNPDLVTPPSTWGMDVGMAETQVMLDERRLVPGKDFDAVAAANDEMIIGAWDVLQARGVSIPDDVAVVGFDDRLEGRTRTPPLTSVAGSFHEIGYRSVETLLALMAGEHVPEETTVPSRLVVRQSCGCLAPVVAQVAVEQQPATRQTRGSQKEFEAVLSTQREEILAKMAQAASELGGSLDLTSAGQLLDGFVAELNGEPQGTFLIALDEVLRREVAVVSDATENNLVAMQSALTAMRRSFLSCLNVEALAKAEDLWQQARLEIAETTRRVDMRLTQQAVQQSQTLREIGASLITAFDRKALADALAETLPTLGMPSAYLALYEQRTGLSGKEQRPYAYPDPAPEWSRLVLAYTENGQVALAADGMRFRSQQLLPQDLWPQGRQYSYVVNPLYFLDQQIGFALLEVGPRDGDIYDVLRGEISSALQGNLLREQVRERAVQLQTAAEVSRVTSSILEPEVLIEQVVDLVRERFDLYYVGLFLVEEISPGTEGEQWAVLQAGTGEAGQQMVAQGHRLAVGGKSMVGQCLQSRQARIALDVGESAVRFENPFLPETRSELALPLVSRGEAIGALTIQSTEEAAFSDEDVAVLQTMADQVANAIENVRLFDRSQEALREMEATQRRYQQRAWSEYAQVAPVTSYETQRHDRAPLGDEILPEIQVALKNSEPTILRKPGAGAALVAPITQRGAAIGALGVHLEDTRRELTEDELALVQAVAERVGLAAETLRLLDETQRSAAQERLVGEVTARVRATLDMNTILQTAVREIAQALDAQQAEVRLGTGSLSDPEKDIVSASGGE